MSKEIESILMSALRKKVEERDKTQLEVLWSLLIFILMEEF